MKPWSIIRRRIEAITAERSMHVGVQPLAAKVEVAVFEADILGIFGIARDRHRQLRSGRLDVDGGRDDLDLAGRQLGVHHVGGAGDDLAGHRHHRFDAQRFERARTGLSASATIWVIP